jgi:hypothetical protein
MINNRKLILPGQPGGGVALPPGEQQAREMQQMEMQRRAYVTAQICLNMVLRAAADAFPGGKVLTNERDGVMMVIPAGETEPRAIKLMVSIQPAEQEDDTLDTTFEEKPAE